MLLVGNGP